MPLVVYRLPTKTWWWYRAEGAVPHNAELCAGLVLRKVRGGMRVFRCAGDRYGCSLEAAISAGLIVLR
jgi:hypothetical protein